MLLRRLLSYWPSARKEVVSGGLLLIFAALMELLQPWPIKWLVDYVFGGRPVPKWLKSVWPSFATGNAADGIAAVCISILVLAVIYRTALAVGHFFLVRAGVRIVQQLRRDAYEHLHRLSLAFHDRTKVGDSLYRVAYDAHAAQAILNGALVPAAIGCLTLVGATIIMLRMNPLLTITTMAAAPLFVVIIRGFSRRIDQQ